MTGSSVRTNIRMLRNIAIASRSFGTCMIVLSVLVLIGWQFDIELFTSVLPGFIAMNPMSATLFLLSGLWICLSHESRRQFAIGIPAAVAVISGMKLLSFAGIELHVDHLLFTEKLAHYDPPNNMAPNTAVNFFLIGIAMLLHESPARMKAYATQALSLFVGSNALLAIVGYSYGAEFLYTIGPFIGMALHTAFLFVVLSIGVLSLYPTEGVMRTFTSIGSGGTIGRRLIIVAILFPLLFGWAEMLGLRLGYYTPQTGTVFATMGLIILFSLFIWKDASRVDEVDKAKTEFVSIASHQLRTPLTSVNWYSEMLLQYPSGARPKKYNEYLQKIHAGSQRMVSLVDTLLNVSRIELGTLPVEWRPVDVVELIRATIEEQRPQIAERNLALTLSVPRTKIIIRADPSLLQMIFQNLLSNAIKYTPPRGRVKVSVAQTDGDFLLVRVADTGYGIPQKDYGKIFSKMFRADNVKQKGSDGTGLGLYIVKSVITTMGGSIWFDSVESKGTTFYVRLPLGTRG